MKEIFDYIDYIEDMNKQVNIDWTKYIDSKKNDLMILDKLKDLLGILNVREDISYNRKRKDNIVECKKIAAINQIKEYTNIKSLSDLEFEYSDNDFISEYIIEGDKHIITNCFFENEGEDLYIVEYTLSKLTKDLDTTITLLQIYSMLEGVLYFYSNNECDMFVMPLEETTKDILFNQQKEIFETKLNFTKQIYDIVAQ